MLEDKKMTVLIALLVGFSSLGRFVLPSLLAAGIVLIYYLFKHRFVIRFGRLLSLRKNAYSFSVAFILFWLVYSFFSILWSKDRAAYFYQMEFFAFAIIVGYLMVRNVYTKKQYMYILKVVIWVSIVINVFGWIEVLSGRYFFMNDAAKVVEYSIQRMPVTFFQNTNDFATYLMSIFFLLIPFIKSKKGYKVFPYYLLMISSLGLVYMAGSKANLIGIIIGICALFIGEDHKSRYKIIIICIMIVAIAIISVGGNISVVIELIKNTLTHQYKGDSSSYFVRIHLIQNAIRSALYSYGVGFGAGNSSYFMSKYAVYNTYGVFAVHNMWMEILIDYGVLITLLFVIFYIKNMLFFYKNRKTSYREYDYISFSIFCFLASYIIGSLSSSSNMKNNWIIVIFAIIISYQKCLTIGGVQFET